MKYKSHKKSTIGGMAVLGILSGLMVSLTASAQNPPIPPEPISPVVIYDDLLVFGKKTVAEPGNTFIHGNLYSQGSINVAQSLNVGNARSTHQLTGDLTVASGGLNTTGNLNVGGILNVGTIDNQKRLNINGTLVWNGNTITPNGGSGSGGSGGSPASFSTITGSASAAINDATWKQSSASCGGGATIISCTPNFSFENPPQSEFNWTADINNKTCTVQAHGTQNFAATESFTVRAVATCAE